MRHPFDGILVPVDDVDASQANTTRRQMLQVVVAAGALPLLPSLAAAAPIAGSASPAQVFGASENVELYFVMPEVPSQFTAAQRTELHVHGPYLPGLEYNHQLKATPGFLAWLNAAHVATAQRAANVRGIHKIVAADIAADSKATGGEATDGEATDERDQLALIATTLAAREEGGGVTTYALGEEGGGITLAIGEDGGVITTKALGEEGASTKKLGEEGGSTTKRMGEEGGSTTKRSNEEGGGTTQAIGEEGGSTTKRLGEEGGKAS